MDDRHYILNGHEVVKADLMTWGRWFEDAGDTRIVAKSRTANGDVSTVFLGLDHRFGNEGPPLLFETMVFGGSLDQEQERCSTWEEAEAQHAAMLARVEAAKETP